MSVELQRRRFTVHDYYAMADAGILGEDERVELIDGEIIQMPPIGSHHAAWVDRLNAKLGGKTGARAIVRVQNPVRLSDLSEPQPDLALLRPREDFYAGGHPGPGDTLLIVEVAHTTLGYDREVKLPLYALAGIPEVWIVDVEKGEVEVYRQPEGPRFGEATRAGPGDVLRPLLVPSVSVRVERLLG
jgi:Uma2 family endonuclease